MLCIQIELRNQCDRNNFFLKPLVNPYINNKQSKALKACLLNRSISDLTQLCCMEPFN